MNSEKETQKKPFKWVNKKWCKRCHFCVEFCPKGVYELDEEGYPEPVHIDHCIDCGLCVVQCPDFAIVDDEETKERIMGEYIIEEDEGK